MNTSIKRYKDEKGKDRLTLSGIDFGHGDCTPYIIKETEHFILTRVRGRNWRSSLAQTSYANPEFNIYEKLNKDTIKDALTKENYEYTQKTKTEVYSKVLIRLDELGLNFAKPQTQAEQSSVS